MIHIVLKARISKCEFGGYSSMDIELEKLFELPFMPFYGLHLLWNNDEGDLFEEILGKDEDNQSEICWDLEKDHCVIYTAPNRNLFLEEDKRAEADWIAWYESFGFKVKMKNV